MATISTGLWRDLAENKTIEVTGMAIDENTLAVLVLWREQNDKQIWAKQLTHWNARTDDGKKRFQKVND